MTEAVFPNANSLLILSLLFFTGLSVNLIAGKYKLPLATLQILAGFIIGPHVLKLFPESIYEDFRIIINFAFGIIGFTIGSHLDMSKLHNSLGRIFSLVIVDIIFVPLCVFTGLYFLTDLPLQFIILFAFIASFTDPASLVETIKEKKAKGVLSKTSISFVALNNVLVIIVFYFIIHFILFTKNNFMQTISLSMLYFLKSLLNGLFASLIIIYLVKKNNKLYNYLPSIITLFVVFVVGIAETYNFSGFLSALTLGVILTNFLHYKQDYFKVFDNIEKEIYMLFFVLAGFHFSFQEISKTNYYLGLIFIVVRFFGKIIAVHIAGYFSDSLKIIKKWLAFSLLPYAGVVVGIMFYFEPYLKELEYFPLFKGTVYMAIIAYEIIAPFFLNYSLLKSNEADKDKVRLMDFLQEEYIITGIKAKDKWQVINILAELLYKSHKIKNISLENLKKDIIEKEKSFSSAIGVGIAIPHIISKTSSQISGVVGIIPQGIDFDSMIDNTPVKIVFLVITPQNLVNQHVKILSNISNMFIKHPYLKEKLAQVKNSAEAFYLFENEEIEEFNSFLN